MLVEKQLAAHIPSASTAETPADIQLMMCTLIEIEMKECSLISHRLPVFLMHFLWHRRLNSLGQKGSAAYRRETPMRSRVATGVRENNQSVFTHSYFSYMELYKKDSNIQDRALYTTSLPSIAVLSRWSIQKVILLSPNELIAMSHIRQSMMLPLDGLSVCFR